MLQKQTQTVRQETTGLNSSYCFKIKTMSSSIYFILTVKEKCHEEIISLKTVAVDKKGQVSATIQK